MLPTTVLAAARRRLIVVPVVLALAACSAAPAPTVTQQTDSAPTQSQPPASTPTRPGATPEATVAVPETLWGDWHAEAPTVEGLGPHDPWIQVSFNWQDGLAFWVQVDGAQMVRSRPLRASAGEIRLASSDAISGCELGNEGRYRWERSGDGLFLDVSLIEDACPLRASILARRWVHSLGAVNDGGTGFIRFTDARWLGATVPSFRFALSGDGAIDLHTFAEADPGIELIVISDPMGQEDLCDETPIATPISAGPKGLIDYVREVPGAEVERSAATVGGLGATRLDVEFGKLPECRSLEQFAPFRGETGADGGWTFGVGESVSLWVVDVDGAAVLIWYRGEEVSASDAEAVISTIEFPGALPAG